MSAHAAGWLPVCDPSVMCDVCGLSDSPQQAAFVRVVDAKDHLGVGKVLREARCADHVPAAAGHAGRCGHKNRCANAVGRS